MSPTPPNSDLASMQRALDLARDARGHVWPNPPIGCVIVRDGTIIAEAATQPGGRPHAERKALDMAGDDANGATLYVTLEPCCRWGKTPPCADAIIEACISRVVCAIQDPDPRVNGGGFETLRRAGVELSIGLCADDAETLMSGFFHRVRTGTPELVTGDVDLGTVPDGVDAVLRTSRNDLILETRADLKAIPPKPPDEVMRWLDDLGLTRIVVPRNDPFLRGFGISGDRAFSDRTSTHHNPLLGTRA